MMKGEKMPLMTNAEAFRYDFGINATELWAMTEAQFLEWLNADCDRERPNAVPVVRCKDCVWYYQYCLTDGTMFEHCRRGYGLYVDAEGFCAWGKKRLPDDDPLWEEEDG